MAIIRKKQASIHRSVVERAKQFLVTLPNKDLKKPEIRPAS